MSTSSGRTTSSNSHRSPDATIIDDFPVEFCENIFTCCADAIREAKGTTDEMPVQSPYQASLVHDLLDNLSSDDLKALDRALTSID